jgi:menaquinone-dependent protoporphyrinogen IX oxidase
VGKTAVIYKSKYGHTKQYAEWIAESLEADLFEDDKIKSSELSHYDKIIYGGGLYAGGINGAAIISKNFKSIKDKNLIVFTVGLASPEDPGIYTAIIEKAFTEEMRKNIKFFHFRGGINYRELGMVHKGMMAMLKKMVEKKTEEEMTEEDKQMLATYGDQVDFSDRKSVEPLLEYMLEMKKGEGSTDES